ncbi:MAG: universal stress protein [Deltaproteobacteria bacterium]|nr:universal stress protein [Deltaproteobacteria bacterium]
MIRRIVVGYDFSENADDALAWTLDLARQTQSTVYLVHVTNAPSEDHPSVEETRGRLSHVADELGPEVASHVLVADDVADALVHFAEDNNADLLVVATAGLAGVARWLLGSVAEAVLKKAHCPVVTLRQDERA